MLILLFCKPRCSVMDYKKTSPSDIKCLYSKLTSNAKAYPKKKKKKSTKSPDSTWISSNKCRHCFAQPPMVRLFFVSSCPILFFFPAVAWRILVSWPEIEPAPSALESQRLDHWIAREALELPYFTGGGSRGFFYLLSTIHASIQGLSLVDTLLPWETFSVSLWWCPMT